MSTTIHDSLTPRVQAGAVVDRNDPDPEVPERARGPRRYLGEVQGPGSR